ncbi:MAG: hypothetical protein KA055_01870 [Aliarcobacter sp.]|nr:hypothetical protein [Aliarcobacter sp.]
MFKQVKSAFFWYYLFKFRKRVLIITLLLIVALFANAIYGDVVEYLKLKNKLDFLEIALISKWVIIIFNIVFSVYLLLTMFKKQDEVLKKQNKKEENSKMKFSKMSFKKEEKSEIKKEEKFTAREKEFLNKKKIRSAADLLVENKK